MIYSLFPCTQGERAGVSGGPVSHVENSAFCEGRSTPLTPAPSPSEYRGRGEECETVKFKRHSQRTSRRELDTISHIRGYNPAAGSGPGSRHSLISFG